MFDRFDERIKATQNFENIQRIFKGELTKWSRKWGDRIEVVYMIPKRLTYGTRPHSRWILLSLNARRMACLLIFPRQKLKTNIERFFFRSQNIKFSRCGFLKTRWLFVAGLSRSLRGWNITNMFFGYALLYERRCLLLRLEIHSRILFTLAKRVRKLWNNLNLRCLCLSGGFDRKRGWKF